MGPGRLELPTSRLSGVCSNHLSYRPLKRSARTKQKPQGSRARPDNAIAPQPDAAAAIGGKRNGDGDVPHLFGVFGEPIGRVSILEAHP